MKTPWWMLLLALAAFALGCPSTGGDDDDSAAADDDDTVVDDDDTVADDDDAMPDDDDTMPPDDDDSSSDAAFFTGYVFEPETDSPIEGANITVVQEPDILEITDATGGYGVQVFKIDEVDIRAEATGYVPSTVSVLAYVNTDPANGVLHVMLPPQMQTMLAQGLGTAHDAARGTLIVAAVDGADEPLVGAQIAIDSDNAGPLLLGAGPPGPGDTLTATETMAVFVNVEVLPTTVTLTVPGGLTCAGRNPIEPLADELLSVTFVCE